MSAASNQISTFQVPLGRGKKSLTFVSGLFWAQYEGGTTREQKRSLATLEENLRTELHVKLDSTKQAGFASKAGGARDGLLSAAAVVSKALEMRDRTRSFICAFPIGHDRFLLVTQSDGLIVENGDVCGSSMSIRAQMLEHLSMMPSVDVIYAPSAWGISESKQIEFSDLLPKNSRGVVQTKDWWELAPIQQGFGRTLRRAIPLLVVGVVILFGGFGYKIYQNHRMAAELEAIAAQEAADAAAMAPQPLPHPWKTQPRASVYAAACEQALFAVPTLFAGNWTLTSATCADKSLVIMWSRSSPTATVRLLQEVIPSAVIAPDGDHATLNVPVNVVFPINNDEAVPVLGPRLNVLHASVQSLGLRMMKFDPPEAAPVMPGDKSVAGQGAGIKDWQERNWRIDAGVLRPSTVLEVVDGAGFRVSRIQATWSAGAFSWSMEGVQYVQQ